MFYWLTKFENNWKKYGQPGAQINLNSDIIRSQKIKLPSIKEQNKISSLFAKLDNLIDLQAKKLELLKQLKQGLLQKLFPQNNQTTPQLRFKGFNEKWKHLQFKDLIINYPIKLFITDKCNKDGKYPIIQQGYFPIFGCSDKNPFKNYKNVVIFGDHTLSLYKPQKPFLLATDGVKVISIPNFDNFFTYYVIEKYLPHSQGYKRHFKILKETKLTYPTLSEQQQIGSLFNKLDNLLTKTQEKITLFKQVKKYLLQRMFI